MSHAVALSAGEYPQQAGGRTARGRGKLIVLNVDRPGPLADRNAREGDDVTGVELALGMNESAAASDKHRNQHDGARKSGQSKERP